ncbi:PKD domain-containing protein [Methanosarcina sp.]|uniref:PKD domain-containing protein n=1 Tax=Methanosarcina sp. TaxID=2213 RepID=UPI003C75439C
MVITADVIKEGKKGKTKRESKMKYKHVSLLRVTSICLTILLLGLMTASIIHAETYSYVMQWGSNGKAVGQFDVPMGIAVDSLDNIYIADKSNHRIQEFSSDGLFIKCVGDIQSAESCSKGSSKGEFNEPVDIAVDSSGNIYVADSGNDRIQKFDSNGNYLTQWGSSGMENGQFFSLTSVAVDSSGNVYVADHVNIIQKFDSSGKFITKWGSSGSDNGQFSLPYDIAIDSSDSIYVADTYNNRIQKFDSNGRFISNLGSQVGDDRQFNNPSGVTVDFSDNIYVADKLNDRILKFDSNDNLIAKWGSSGMENGKFYYPQSVAIDSSGSIYVVDSTNNRIQKFAIKNDSLLQPPVASFTSSVTSGTVPLSVVFTDTSTGTPTSWLWDFGDRTTSTDQNPTHTFVEAGSYTVKLTIKNEVGSSINSNVFAVAKEQLHSTQTEETNLSHSNDSNSKHSNSLIDTQTVQKEVMELLQNPKIKIIGLIGIVFFAALPVIFTKVIEDIYYESKKRIVAWIKRRRPKE